MTFEEIEDDMAFLDAWEDRYAHIIDLGKTLPVLEDNEKNDITKVRGCASQVWIVPAFDNGRFHFRGESDAMIVQGLIFILLALYNDKTADEILAIDAIKAFESLGLSAHLSAQRSNGLKSMVERIQQLANDAKSA